MKQREETLEKKAAKQCKVEQAKRPGNSQALRTGRQPVDDAGKPSSRNEEDMVDRRTHSSKQTNNAAQTIARRLANDNEEVDPNTCYMCFVSFEEDLLDGGGAEWVPCPCGRWLHDDCTKRCVRDKNGKECYPICIDILSVHV